MIMAKCSVVGQRNASILPQQLYSEAFNKSRIPLREQTLIHNLDTFTAKKQLTFSRCKVLHR